VLLFRRSIGQRRVRGRVRWIYPAKRINGSVETDPFNRARRAAGTCDPVHREAPMATIDQVYARQAGYYRLLEEGDETHPNNLKQLREDIAVVRTIVSTHSGGDDGGPVPVFVRLDEAQLEDLKNRITTAVVAKLTEQGIPRLIADAVAAREAAAHRAAAGVLDPAPAPG
jgi:hypothetical protein